MFDDVARQLEAEFARLGIARSEPAASIVGDPPWLYSAEFMLQVARTLPDGAGAAALGRALVASRAGPQPPGDARSRGT
ncbi:MAG: hypothetical protein ABR499_01085 [Gemmatimonadaceae bacterium]